MIVQFGLVGCLEIKSPPYVSMYSMCKKFSLINGSNYDYLGCVGYVEPRGQIMDRPLQHWTCLGFPHTTFFKNKHGPQS
jgi:hypothetical protein